MASIILIGIVVSVLFYHLYKYMFYKPPNFPPGPPRIPIFGSYLFFLLLNYRHLQRGVAYLCKYYNSNILGFYLGDYPTVALYDADSVKESLFHTAFDGKPSVFLAKLREPEYKIRGIFFTDGPFWKNQRRFALRHLRDYGFGRRFEELEIEIGEEIKNLIDLIRNGPKYECEQEMIKDKNALVPLIFTACTSNSFLKVLTNERRSREDYDDLFRISKEVLHFQRNGDAWGRLFSIDSIQPIVCKFPKLSGYQILRSSSEKIYAFIKDIIDEQIKTYDSNHERSVLDRYIKEIKEAEKNNESSFFYYEQLTMICVDFFFPPSSAIPITISFLLQRIILQPEVQGKMQKEIDDVVGHGRLPTLDDRINLPYTEAAIREIMRLETLVPSGLPHFSMEDTTFRGYDVPKGSFILPMLIGSHYDSTKWINPEEFYPERFLDTNGKLCLKKDFSLPFGAGKRLCAGETFARNMLFLMVSALLQNFNIKATDEQKVEILTKPQTGLVSFLPDYTITFESR